MAIADVILGALGGGVITYLAQNYIRILAEDVALLNDHISDMVVLENAVTDYWLSSASHSSECDARMRARIFGALSVVDCFRPHAKRLLGGKAKEYWALDADFYDISTGGAFETSVKQMDADRAKEVMVLANKIRAVLRAARRSLYWAR